ncbi:colicin E5-related ribonuclease [Paenibacillus amylolyticus]|uniref:colicin E5-related ribonuclease n=1 Tax=Paenibacillus amylolyticus TaxID=1451 RepID=UPI0037CB82A8
MISPCCLLIAPPFSIKRGIDQRKGQNNAPVTVFYHQDGDYVVRRNDSGEIIQISQVDDPIWSTYWSDDDINWNK